MTFEIRVHHLLKYGKAVEMGPKLAAQREQMFFRSTHNLGSNFRLRDTDLTNHPDVIYYSDLLGEKPEISKPIHSNKAPMPTALEEEYVDKLRTTYIRFISLKNEDVIKLITQGKDLFCHCAAIGDHCTNPNQPEFFPYVEEVKLLCRLESHLTELSIVEEHPIFGITTFKDLVSFLGKTSGRDLTNILYSQSL